MDCCRRSSSVRMSIKTQTVRLRRSNSQREAAAQGNALHRPGSAHLSNQQFFLCVFFLLLLLRFDCVASFLLQKINLTLFTHVTVLYMLVIKIIILNIHKFTFQSSNTLVCIYLIYLINTHGDLSIILDP